MRNNLTHHRIFTKTSALLAPAVLVLQLLCCSNIPLNSEEPAMTGSKQLLKELNAAEFGLYHFYYTNDSLDSFSVSLGLVPSVYHRIKSGDTIKIFLDSSGSNAGESWNYIYQGDSVIMYRTFGASVFQPSIGRLNTDGYLISITNVNAHGDTWNFSYDQHGNIIDAFPYDSVGSVLLGVWKYDTMKNAYSSLPLDTRLMWICSLFGFNLGANNPVKHFMNRIPVTDTLRYFAVDYTYDAGGYPCEAKLIDIFCHQNGQPIAGIIPDTFCRTTFSYY